jgi:hypothetical protein
MDNSRASRSTVSKSGLHVNVASYVFWRFYDRLHAVVLADGSMNIDPLPKP